MLGYEYQENGHNSKHHRKVKADGVHKNHQVELESKDDDENVEIEEKKAMDVDAFEKQMIPVLKEGYLFKRKQKGLRMKGIKENWQNRYCVVDNVKKTVSYGPHEMDVESGKSIPFSEIKCAYVAPRQGETMENAIQFNVELIQGASNNNGSRVFSFRASDPMTAREWVKVIQSISLDGKTHNERKRRLSRMVEQKLERLESTKKMQAVKEEIIQIPRKPAFEPFELDTSTPPSATATKSAEMTKRFVQALEQRRKQRLQREFKKKQQQQQQDEQTLPSSKKPYVFRACLPCLRFFCLKRHPKYESEESHDDDFSTF